MGEGGGTNKMDIEKLRGVRGLITLYSIHLTHTLSCESNSSFLITPHEGKQHK